MAGSIVVAFGLLAVFAMVRFRNVLKDTRDTSFVLWAITEGLGIGTLRYSTALIAALGIAAVVLYLRFTDFGSRHRHDAVLNLRLTGDPVAGVAALQGVLRRYRSRVLLANERRHTDEGVDLSYRLLLRDPRRDGELKSDLGRMAGLEQISLFLRTDESEAGPTDRRQAGNIDGDTLRASLAGGAAHEVVRLNADGSFSYRPNADYNGTDE